MTRVYQIAPSQTQRIDWNYIMWRTSSGLRILARKEAFLVMGPPKPATGGRGKTGHFERQEIESLPSSSGLYRETATGWPINSRWRKYKQFWHLHEAAGRTGTSRGNWAYIARRCRGIVAWIQNRPARPSARIARPPALEARPSGHSVRPTARSVPWAWSPPPALAGCDRAEAGAGSDGPADLPGPGAASTVTPAAITACGGW